MWLLNFWFCHSGGDHHDHLPSKPLAELLANDALEMRDFVHHAPEDFPLDLTIILSPLTCPGRWDGFPFHGSPTTSRSLRCPPSHSVDQARTEDTISHCFFMSLHGTSLHDFFTCAGYISPMLVDLSPRLAVKSPSGNSVTSSPFFHRLIMINWYFSVEFSVHVISFRSQRGPLW